MGRKLMTSSEPISRWSLMVCSPRFQAEDVEEALSVLQRAVQSLVGCRKVSCRPSLDCGGLPFQRTSALAKSSRSFASPRTRSRGDFISKQPAGMLLGAVVGKHCQAAVLDSQAVEEGGREAGRVSCLSVGPFLERCGSCLLLLCVVAVIVFLSSELDLGLRHGTLTPQLIFGIRTELRFQSVAFFAWTPHILRLLVDRNPLQVPSITAFEMEAVGTSASQVLLSAGNMGCTLSRASISYTPVRSHE